AGGAAPARADAPAIACADSITNVYVTPTGLPSMTDALRGDVVRCSKDSDVALADVAAEVLSKGVTTTMTSPVAIYRIAFRTERGDGSAGVSTARVYLPQAPAALPLPVITIGHPTDGIADSCAPSEDATSNEDLALPWAGLGYAVIVPDYAGLGNEGVQSYLDNRDQAHAVLDGARALRAMLSPGALSTQVLAVGYSQGGGAVMSAQALASTYGAGGDLVGAIVFAPEWPTRLNSFGYVDQLENPDELTIETGISEDVVTVMRTYGWAYNALGEAHATDGFPSAQRSGFESAINSLCQTPLGGYLQGTAYTVGGIFDDSFRTSVLACVNSSGADPGCVDPGKSYYEYLVANFVTSDPNGAKVLYVQGLADYIMPAASEASCNLEKLANDGVTPTVCVDAAAQHQTVVGRNMDFALEWGFALLRGEGLPTCSSDGMPTCQP
ncbi:MAG TPA: lipase family protein, partial [Byssovorax sp.]